MPLDYGQEPPATGKILGLCSLIAGLISLVRFISYGLGHFVFHSGPNGLLLLPFLPVSLAGAICAGIALFNGRRAWLGLVLNLSGTTLFFVYAFVVPSIFWMAP
jgi:hypothetical protein